MLFLIGFKNSCEKYEGAKGLTLTCLQHRQFEKSSYQSMWQSLY